MKYLYYSYTALLGFPKTIFLNFCHLPFWQAVRFPIIVAHTTSIRGCKGKIAINGKVKPGLLWIGFQNVRIFDRRRSRTVWALDGTITINGTAKFGHGSKISVTGELILGGNFIITAESEIICSKKIIFGDDCLISWDVLIMDGDGHPIFTGGQCINENKEIVIGNKVWIGCRTLILKGVCLGNNIVVAAASVVTKNFLDDSVIIGGSPAKIIKRDVRWEQIDF